MPAHFSFGSLTVAAWIVLAALAVLLVLGLTMIVALAVWLRRRYAVAGRPAAAVPNAVAPAVAENLPEARLQIMRRLSAGEITPEQAEAALSRLRGPVTEGLTPPPPAAPARGPAVGCLLAAVLGLVLAVVLVILLFALFFGVRVSRRNQIQELMSVQQVQMEAQVRQAQLQQAQMEGQMRQAQAQQIQAERRQNPTPANP